MLIPSYWNNKRFRELCYSDLNTLRYVSDSEPNKELQNKLNYEIDATQRTGDLNKLFNVLKENKSSIQGDNNASAYVKAYDKALNSMTQFFQEKESSIIKLHGMLDDLDKIKIKISEKIDAPENRIPEILKRLILGIVVSTFFLVILKYVANIYQSHYNQMLVAEYDDMTVRRFYIVYKASEDNEEQRKAVLSLFLSEMKSKESLKNDETIESRIQKNDDLIRELFKVLSKKL